MNDQHPHAGYAGYDSRLTGSFDTDPLFGSLPDHQDGSHGTGYGSGCTTAHDGTYGGYDTAYAAGPQQTAPYDTAQHEGQWDTGAHQQASYDAYGAQAYGTTAAWMPEATIPAQAAHPGTATPDSTGQWDTTGWDHTGQADQWATSDTGAFPTTTFSSTAYATGTYAAPVFETSGYETADTGAYDATAWNTGASPETAAYAPEQTSHPAYEHQATSYEAAEFSPQDHADGTAATKTAVMTASDTPAATGAYDPDSAYDPAGVYDPDGAYSPAGEHDAVTDIVDVIDVTASHPASAARPVGRSAPRGGGRGRRRTPAKRSALLTVAVPSACVMSVAGIAAASVGGVGGAEEQKDETTSMAVADTVEPDVANNELDTQLANLSADAENFADRASRTQERIDLKVRQAAEKKKREDEAARREAARPKFALPVSQHGLSAYYGQAGVNWMSAHTGIDFPVGLGTPVMAATDGTVRTQLNSAYGNMVIVTAADGTETWYCHLSAAKIRSGSVKAGDVIGYAGDSGNSTGPHLHFEVRPGGGASIDPLAWLRSHGLNPS
ncbi:M23 family metallopeptidase [Streptomyces sp. NPDC057429]|uniref:M23 family metallopeptidase n=1 Tax=Streptomyces sp. NPDC057429 TaxID=3346130 RepID=UPI0036A5003E